VCCPEAQQLLQAASHLVPLLPKQTDWQSGFCSNAETTIQHAESCICSAPPPNRLTSLLPPMSLRSGCAALRPSSCCRLVGRYHVHRGPAGSCAGHALIVIVCVTSALASEPHTSVHTTRWCQSTTIDVPRARAAFMGLATTDVCQTD
jgi:hypothetical protein